MIQRGLLNHLNGAQAASLHVRPSRTQYRLWTLTSLSPRSHPHPHRARLQSEEERPCPPVQAASQSPVCFPHLPPASLPRGQDRGIAVAVALPRCFLQDVILSLARAHLSIRASSAPFDFHDILVTKPLRAAHAPAGGLSLQPSGSV
jgi:hypothetical protein